MKKNTNFKSIYAGRVLDVGLETHQLPTGRQSSFEIIRHPGGAAVLPILPDGRLVLIRQYRPAVEAMIYEIPAGRLEPGELPLQCAARELEEEAGYRAAKLEPLGGMWSAVGFCDEYVNLFLATELTPVERSTEPDEVIEVTPLTLEQALQLLDGDQIGDAKTQLAILNYQRRFDGRMA